MNTTTPIVDSVVEFYSKKAIKLKGNNLPCANMVSGYESSEIIRAVWSK